MRFITSFFLGKEHRKWEDLKPYSICNIRGTYVSEKSGKSESFLVKSPKQAFLMVSKNRCDTFIGPQFVGTWMIKSMGLQQSVSGIPDAIMARFSYHLMIGKHSRFLNILPKFDQVLIKLKRKGILMEIQKKYQ